VQRQSVYRSPQDGGMLGEFPLQNPPSHSSMAMRQLRPVAHHEAGILVGERGSILAFKPPLKLVTLKPFCANIRAAK